MKLALLKPQNLSFPAGFTLVELIAVILLLGILSAVAMPKFFDVGAYQNRGFYDETVAAVRYAQKLAVASGCEVQVQMTAGGFSLWRRDGADCRGGAFTRAIAHPARGEDYAATAPAGVSLSAGSVIFDARGRPSTGLTVTVGGERSFQIVAETGYVDAQ